MAQNKKSMLIGFILIGVSIMYLHNYQILHASKGMSAGQPMVNQNNPTEASQSATVTKREERKRRRQQLHKNRQERRKQYRNFGDKAPVATGEFGEAAPAPAMGAVSDGNKRARQAIANASVRRHHHSRYPETDLDIAQDIEGNNY